MSNAFYITFWSVLLALIILGFIYSFYAHESIGSFEGDDTSRTLEAQEFLLWSLILQGIAIAFVALVIIYGIIFDWGGIYNNPPIAMIIYVFFFVWVLCSTILLFVAFERIGASIDILASKALRDAKNDIGVTLASSATVLVLLIIGYIGYVYRYVAARDKWSVMCLMDRHKT